MGLASLLKSKKECWDIIKRYYLVYEDKSVVFKEILEKYVVSSMVLLDAGCGSGKETPFDYTKRVKLAVGVDLSQKIQENKTLHVKIVGDICQIPLKNNFIDIVVCQELVEHLKFPQVFFKEVARILKPNGIFIVMTPNLLGWKSLISKMTPYPFHIAVNKSLYGVTQNDVFPTYYNANTIFTLKNVLSRNGFGIIESRFFEGSPRTLAFWEFFTYLEIYYVRFIRRFNCLMQLRETIILVAKKL